MFSYRHAFHAGNHADVLKHVVLIATLKYLTQKDGALQVVDTHAGAGLYRIDGDAARTSGEVLEGFLKLHFTQNHDQNQPLAHIESASPAIKKIANQADEMPEIVSDYLAMVASFNSGKTPKVYPGSPLIAHSLLRQEARDKLKLFEMHPTDSRSLIGHVEQLGAGRTVQITVGDGFEGLKALIPPPSKRGLILIDPSYEMKSDYARVLACVGDAVKRFPTGCYMVWYPIIPRPESHDLPRKLKNLAALNKRSWLNATLNIGADEPAKPAGKVTDTGHAAAAKRAGLRESGVFLINPPFTLKAALQQALPYLKNQIGRGQGAEQSLTSGG
jgi:23S rRNA (adenine2030-N6)-methyltransferase